MFLKKNPLQTILFFLVFIFSCKQDVSVEKTSYKLVDTYIKKVMERYGIPGSALAIIRDKEPKYIQYYGVSNLEFNIPIKDSTIFQLSSLSKVFSSTAIFQLIDQGKINLEDNISVYLDDLPPDWTEIKVANLLSHSSGLPEIANYMEYSEDEAQEKVYKDQLLFKSGESTQYNQTNFWLLSRIINKVGESDFQEFIIDNQFPTSSNAVVYAGNYHDIIKNRATSYEPDNQNVFKLRKYEFPNYLYAAAGLNSSLPEFILWDQKLTSNQLLNAESKAKMWSPFILNNEEISSFSYGWHVRNIHERFTVGFSGGFNTGYRKFIDDDLTIILLTNGYEVRYNIVKVIENIAGLIDQDLSNSASQLHENILSLFLENDLKDVSNEFNKIKNTLTEQNFENIINSVGYELLGLNKTQSAIKAFELNANEYPNSWNAFDSLGEGYELFGNKLEAIKNYKKSLALNPENIHAKEKIIDLEKEL